eukprot:gene18087-biopygen3906
MLFSDGLAGRNGRGRVRDASVSSNSIVWDASGTILAAAGNPGNHHIWGGTTCTGMWEGGGATRPGNGRHDHLMVELPGARLRRRWPAATFLFGEYREKRPRTRPRTRVVPPGKLLKWGAAGVGAQGGDPGVDGKI